MLATFLAQPSTDPCRKISHSIGRYWPVAAPEITAFQPILCAAISESGRSIQGDLESIQTAAESAHGMSANHPKAVLELNWAKLSACEPIPAPRLFATLMPLILEGA
jgi:hypothetical protein